MITFRIHTNGWTVLLENVDLATITQFEVDQIARLLANYTTVVIKKQKIDVDNYLRFIKMFKDPVQLFQPSDEEFKHITIPNSDGYILRVGGKVDDYGVPGIAEHVEDMGWHNDAHWELEHKPSLVMLQGAQGTKGSTTSWINTIVSYKDLDDETKELLSSLKCVMLEGTDFNTGKFYTDPDGTKWPEGQIVKDYYPSVVRKSLTGETGLYFPFLQINNFVGMTREESKKILLKISKHITQEKYRYDHEWDEGDIVINDQWLGLHARWKCEHIADRLIYRSAFEYPDLDYKENL